MISSLLDRFRRSMRDPSARTRVAAFTRALPRSYTLVHVHTRWYALVRIGTRSYALVPEHMNENQRYFMVHVFRCVVASLFEALSVRPIFSRKKLENIFYSIFRCVIASLYEGLSVTP